MNVFLVTVKAPLETLTVAPRGWKSLSSTLLLHFLNMLGGRELAEFECVVTRGVPEYKYIIKHN